MNGFIKQNNMRASKREKIILKHLHGITLEQWRKELRDKYPYNEIENIVHTAMVTAATKKVESLSGITERIFSISIIRDLNAMIMNGSITSSKMVCLMNEAIKWQDVGIGMGNHYLRDMIKELKEDPKCKIK